MMRPSMSGSTFEQRLVDHKIKKEELLKNLRDKY
jgi:hypothetical protein